jgi:excisionase family DNA binding protein
MRSNGKHTVSASPQPSVHAESGEHPGFQIRVQASPFLSVEDVAARLMCSTRTVHELTRTCAIPHFKRPGGRRCLFKPAELEAWEAGARLEVVELDRGGRVVRTRP